MQNEKLRRAGIPAIIAIALLAGLAVRLSTRTAGLDNSRYFKRGFVENAVVETVNLIELGDYNTLYQLTAPPLRQKFSEKYLLDYKARIAQDWGRSTGGGRMETSEIIRGGQHYADCTMEMSYENVGVTFHLVFDTDMRLVDLTMEEKKHG